jgi:hypothetical protein
MLELVNVETLRKEAERKIRLYEEQKIVFEIIKDVFKKFDGKQVNKRLATALKNELVKVSEKYLVSYRKDSMDWYEFYIWNNSADAQIVYSNRILLLFSDQQTNDGKLDYSKFTKKFTWLDNPTKNIEEVNKDLDIINNTNIIEEYNKAIETIKHTEETLSALRYSFKG